MKYPRVSRQVRITKKWEGSNLAVGTVGVIIATFRGGWVRMRCDDHEFPLDRDQKGWFFPASHLEYTQ